MKIWKRIVFFIEPQVDTVDTDHDYEYPNQSSQPKYLWPPPHSLQLHQ